MVDPVVAPVITVSVIGPWAYRIWKSHGPKKGANVANLGLWGTGKTTWEECVREEDGGALGHNTREKTTAPGEYWEKNIGGARRNFVSRDYPYTIKEIPRVLDDINPDWIQVFTDIEKWDWDENQAIIERMVDWLRDEDYAERHDPKYITRWSWLKRRYVKKKKRGTGTTGCQLVTIYLNKIDEWRHLDNFTRGEKIREIAMSYLRRSEDNPLRRLRGFVNYEFVALSLWDGHCYRYPRVYGNHMEYADYLIEVTKRL